MQLHKIRGGDEDELYQHKYIIGVGISLESKWFSVENIIELIKWSLEHSTKEVVVYVADSIHAINLEVRKGISHESAIKKANEMGDDLLSKVKHVARETFTLTDINRIKYARWDDLADDAYKEKVAYLYSLYESNVDFQNTIHAMIERIVSDETREFTPEQIHKLGTYILEETPEILSRIPIAGIICDAYVYPFDGDLTRFTEKIQKGEVFPEIKEKIMDTEPKVFLEVR